MEKNINNDELNLEKLYTIIGKYKWLIIIFILIATILMFTKLYFTPSTYISKSILEIKSSSKPKMPNDILLSALSFGGSGKVEKEIELLKTFLVNAKALDKVDLSVQYFEIESYKDIESYKTSPIKVEDITLFNENIIGKKITLHPYKNYFTLSVENSLKDTILQFFTPEKYIELDSNKKHYYGKNIKNDFFKLTVNKNKYFNQETKFTLCGSSRMIYDKIIKKSLQIQQINPDAPLIEISYTDHIPKKADDYINALSLSFIAMSVKTKNEQNNKVLTFINEQLDKTKDTLQSSENKLERYKVNHKIIEPSIQAKKYIEKLSELEIKLSENMLKQKLIKNLLSFARTNRNLDAIAPSLMELNDKPTLQLIATLQSIQLQESNLKTELTDQHPKLMTVRKQMQHINNKIIYNLKNLKSLIIQKNTSLLSEKVIYESKIESLPREEKNIVNINRDYKVSSNMYNYLLKKKTENELLIVSMLADYKIIDKAYTAQKPIKPKKALMMIVAPLIGLLFGIIFATILNGLNKKISTKEDLEALIDFPILGIIPKLQQKVVGLETYNNPNSPFTESYRSLRSNLPAKEEGRAKIIVITSTVAGEGKTTVTSNLAAVCQMANYKSIILNLDLRKPTLHKHFDLNNNKGMSSYLEGKDTIQDIIFATKHTNLHIITSGPIPDNPSELILSNRFSELLDVLKTRYDYIFIDSAPIGLVSDAISIMKIADSNLVVFSENHAEKSYADSIKNMAEKNHLRNIGLVLNKSSSKNNKSYGYGYGYGYGEPS